MCLVYWMMNQLSNINLKAKYIGLYGQKNAKYNCIWSKNCQTLKFEPDKNDEQEDISWQHIFFLLLGLYRFEFLIVELEYYNVYLHHNY